MSYGVEIYDDKGVSRVENSHSSFQLDFFQPTGSGSRSYTVASDEELLVTVFEYYTGTVGSRGVVGDVTVSGNSISWTYIKHRTGQSLLERASVLMVYKRGKV